MDRRPKVSEVVVMGEGNKNKCYSSKRKEKLLPRASRGVSSGIVKFHKRSVWDADESSSPLIPRGASDPTRQCSGPDAATKHTARSQRFELHDRSIKFESGQLRILECVG
jgi:hypothetical protein